MMLNVAETCGATRALGPGLRAVVWVQGCPFHCRGCIAPDWIPDRPARHVDVADLADELLTDPDVEGFTFSGGEPMEQAPALAALIRTARERRALSLICFTGYKLEELSAEPEAKALLSEVDVLIDGRYVETKNDDRGLRGSSNQRIHHLSGRLQDTGFHFDDGPRRAEIRLRGDEALMVGVPPRAVAAEWHALGEECA
ncbi:radical SAM protein [Actinomadura barringtoniae]|uniref:Radical SAM protein n=1 Tax=Actinomadura barringtoniae TaxID=1427535 RepID=A0A939PLA2_9ACTN|nr:4Fe-4S single cluster domain-containing protein [Actinomadura barringtoniae]MBO2454412.1 radical SAM protein [Actinomadura barringtoniae]